MANRYDIIHIDFQASARGANAAIESIRSEAEKSSAEVEKLRNKIDAAMKDGASDDIIAGMRTQLKAEETRYKQFSAAQRELIKGMRVLDEAVKQFNAGSLNEMTAQFQKQANNAARLAQSKLTVGTDEWRQMGAIMQETEQNYARFQRDTQQLIDSIEQGGTIFRGTLEQEKRGLEELMKLVPYMGKEYQDLEHQYGVISNKLKEMADADRRAKGEIVGLNDARRVANQLTEEGAAAAEREREAAESTISTAKQRIAQLEAEKRAKEEIARKSADTVATDLENLRMQQSLIDDEKKAKVKDDEAAMKKRTSAENNRRDAEELKANAETQKTALTELDGEVNKLKGDVKELNDQLANIGKEPVKPQVDTSEIERLKEKLEKLSTLRAKKTEQLKKRENELLPNADSTTWNSILSEVKESKDGRLRPMFIGETKKQFDDVLDVANRFYNIVKKIGIDLGNKQYSEEATKPIKKLAEQYKITEEEARKLVRTLVESSEVQKKYAISFNERFGQNQIDIQRRKDKDKDDFGYSDKTDQQIRIESAQAHLDSASKTEEYRASVIAKYKNEIADLDKQETEIREKLAQITQQEDIKNTDQRRADLEKQRAELQDQLTAKTKERNEAQTKLNNTISEAEKKESEANKQEEKAVELESKHTSKLEKLQGEYDQMKAATDKNIEVNKQNQKALQETNAQISEQGQIIRDAETIRQQATTKGIRATEEAIRILEAENKTIDTNSEEWKKNQADIIALNDALAKMKNQAALQLMEGRMERIPELSSAALSETKRFWETMVAGAEKGSADLAKYEKQLKAITDEEQKRKEEQATMVILNKETSSDEEIKSAIQSLEQLRNAQAHGSEEWERYNQLMQEGKNYLDEWAKVDSVIKMEEQMAKLPQLSDAALQETKRFWETMVAGAEKGSTELAEYEAQLKKVKEQEQERKRLSNEQTAKIITGENPSLGVYSESEIRDAINAAKELHSHMASGSDDAQKLAESIANAESHIKTYGVEAARTAKKQQESDEMMRKQFQSMIDQMNRGIMPSDSAVKAQQQYWQRLIDDPKTAKESIQDYRDQLAEVNKMQEAMVTAKGEAAYEWFEQGADKNASANRIKEMASDLKAYRDSLPQESESDKIAKINEYLAQTGVAAKKAGEEVMSLADALKLAEQAKEGENGFIATPQEIQAATKAINERRDAVIREIKAEREMGNSVDHLEDELDDLTKKLRDLKFQQDNFNVSREKMDMLMKTPMRAASLDELRAAIKRADGELRRMKNSLGENSDKYKDLAAQVKNAKNVLKQMENQSKATTSQFDQAWSRLKTYVGMYMGFNALWNKVQGTAGDLMTLSDKMGEVRKTTNLSADEVGRLSDNLSKMDTRTPITGLLELSAAAGQLGLKSEEDIQGFTEAANKLMVALPEMGKESATEMMRIAIATGEVDKIREQIKNGTIEGSNATAVAMEKVASTIDRLRASSASTAPEITDFVKRVGAVGAQAGISIDQVAALGSTVSSLGMRVEMSATALSRMIPAIRNNAFSLAKSLDVTPDVIRDLFDAGQGMEVILMILQRIKDSNMDEDSIEHLLGMAGMQDIMKELNQQGARAGIVFSGLSQNVDELRKQLGVASQAYAENIAIQKEYDKMNETTAAKWERLKNQVEEAFVSDTAQNFLGDLIDILRGLVDFITDNVSPALQVVSGLVKTFILYWAVLKVELGKNIFVTLIGGIKAMWSGLTNLISNTQLYIDKSRELKKAQTEQARAAIKAEMAQKGLNKAMIANIWMAVAAAVIYLTTKMWSYWQSTREEARETAKLNAELEKEQKKVEDLTNSIGKARAQRIEYGKALQQAQKAVDDAKKGLDGSRESAEKLAKAEANLVTVQNKRNSAMAEEKRLIDQFNNEYSKYLGFMLSEISSTEELASARQLLNDKLRETMRLKEKEAKLNRIENKYGEDRDDAFADLSSAIKTATASRDKKGNIISNPTKAEQVKIQISEAAGSSKDSKEFNAKLIKILRENKVPYRGNNILRNAQSYYNEVANIKEKQKEVELETKGQEIADRKKTQTDFYTHYDNTIANVKKLQGDYDKASGGEKKKAAANLLKEMDTLNEMVKNAGLNYNLEEGEGYKGERESYNAFMDKAEKALKPINAQRNNLLKQAGNEYKPRDTVGGGKTTSVKSSSWGKTLSAESTDWKNMTADELVNRREQMNKFVRAIQTDTDVQAVLKEDAALKKAIEKGMSSDMRTVINWYNTERLKIQDELHARFLTNTGDWMDPKKQRARKKQFTDELKAFIDELDAYYTERKTRIQEAGTEEGISEAEVWNRTIANEAEWRQRRAELQKLYADKGAEVTDEEQKAIFDIIAERTGDSSKMIERFIQKTVKFSHQVRNMGEQGAKEYREWMGKLGLGWEKDFLRSEKALAEHVKVINDIINSERPFNGITENLQENLAKMGILTADMTQERDKLMKQNADMTEFNERQSLQELKRTIFLLGEAENAYSLTIDQLLDDMREKGFKDWADKVSKDESMKQGLLAMLHKTYDSVQDAIKKESSLIKKQVEIAWNDIVLPDGKSLRHAYETVISSLGLQKDQVSRANSLINAGQASERVADKLAIKQMEIQLAMQQHYFLLVKKTGMQRIADLKEQARLMREQGKLEEAERLELDAKHAGMSLNLSLAEEQKKVDEQRVAIMNQLEESQNRLYRALKEWSDLISSSLQSVFEASHAGDPSYYNDLAKLNLTGKGGPGAGTYIITEHAGTEDAVAHYEYLDERGALERQREIENQNAVADAWKKVMDDINMKMSETITDQVNAMLQNASIDANTDATLKNTEALYGLGSAIAGAKEGNALGDINFGDSTINGSSNTETSAAAGLTTEQVQAWVEGMGDNPMMFWSQQSDIATQNMLSNMEALKEGQEATNKTMTQSTQSMFAKMTQAANLYGIAYQAMSNDNLSASQKFEMIAVQAAGQAGIAMLTADWSADAAKVEGSLPAILAECLKINPIWGTAIFAALTAVLGGLMGMAMSKIAKGKAEIAQATGASVGAGRLSTGMLTYAEGNVNEFTDPNTLTPGRSYNVDGADGRTYHAKYTGKDPRTHITNGPEFHLAGEKGREAIIDAHTTRLIQMDHTGIWSAIQTLYNGGSLRHVSVRRRGRGVPAFADGNIDEFGIDVTGGTGMDMSQMKSLQDSIDRQSMLLEDLRINGIKATFDVYGKGGLVDSYDTGKKTVNRHGERY